MKPSIERPASIDLLIFNLLMQSSVLKTHSKNFLYLKSMLQDYSMNSVRTLKSLHQTTERLNGMHAIKFAMAEVSSTVQRIIMAAVNSKNFRDYLWSSFSLLPLGVSVLLKE